MEMRIGGVVCIATTILGIASAQSGSNAGWVGVSPIVALTKKN